MTWDRLAIEAVLGRLKTNTTHGLSSDAVVSRRGRVGPNTFVGQAREGLFTHVLKQFKNPLVVILVIAGAVTLFLGEYIDATVITIAFCINVVIGAIQEGRASRAFEKLRASQARLATVIRDGHKRVVSAEDLVPGDIVVLGAGASVPADARLIDSEDFLVNEAALTGEWVAVNKQPGVLDREMPLSERTNMVWMGTLVAAGFGKAVVVATGGKTQIGSVAESLLDTQNTRTPIQRNIHRLAVFLSYIILAVVVGIFALGLVRNEPLGDMLLLAIALAVSVIPEGLPAAVTAVLAIGMEKILSRGGLVRNLLAAETLGSTTVILTDKTGTLTEAKMELKEFITASGASQDRSAGLAAAILASETFVEETDENQLTVHGRPMERAITRAGLEEGISPSKLRKKYTQKDFQTFDSENRFSASLNMVPGERSSRLYVLGAPELLLERSTHVLKDGELAVLDEAQEEYFNNELNKKTGIGMRAAAVALREVEWEKIPDSGSSEGQGELIGLTFIGIAVFEDPIRKDVASAIATVKESGAKVIMLTGDNLETARYVAKETGVLSDNGEVLSGNDIENISDERLSDILKTANVFARVLPHQKKRISTILRNEGEVVAMTGDGINDAPALQSADIGVAVGSGTEVAKEASDLVLINNSFSIIVAAIEEGRRIIDNLKKVVTHLLSTSFHEVFIIAGSMLLGLPLPVLPVQILWVNILQEGFLSFGFAFEPPERNVMKRNPRSHESRNIVSVEIRKLILIAGIITGIFSLALYLVLLARNIPIEEVRTIMFVVLLLDAIFFAVSLKNLRGPFWHASLFNNRYLIFALVVSVLGVIITISVPQLRSLLSLVPLSGLEVLLLVGVGLFNLFTIEISKYLVFRGS